MWYLVCAATILPIVGLIIYAFYTDKSDGYVGAAIASAVTLVVMIGLAVAKLTVSIDRDSIYYKFTPFVNSQKVIRKEEIDEIYVRKYKPIIEYGGYGYRFRFRSGRAMNVSGNMGLQLILKNGKKLLIGTQRPELMETAVKKLKENWNMNG